MRAHRSRLLAAVFALLLCGCDDNGPPRSSAADGGILRPDTVIGDPYRAGPYTVSNTVIAEGESGAPKRIRLFVPQTAGSWPVLQFNHGFQGSVDSFQTVLTQLASWGYIVVAPQLVPSPSEGGNPSTAPSIDDEVALAAQVADWAQTRLPGLLTGTADLRRYGLLGHSRGGQIVWRLALLRPGLAQAVAGIDPVDGNAPPFSSDTGPLVTQQPFPRGLASYTLGTGLGAQGGPFACAPANRNYTLFYTASASPAWQALATDFGHADMVDTGGVETLACASNPVREGMIAFTGGQLVAFFAHSLKGANSARFLTDLGSAPIGASGQHK